MKKTHHIGIRHQDGELYFNKLRYIAKYEGRSVNRHILYLIRKNIAEYEARNGEIKLPNPDKADKK